MISPLDLNGELPSGTLVLEASAGTGKTYALSHRVLREVAENGRAIDTILVVTFTRAAAAEIRCRIRLRLEQASTALAYRIAGAPSGVKDPTLAALIERWSAAPDALEILLNLLQGIDRIDLAPISTIHGFIQRLIRDNGALLGLDPQVQLQESNRSLLEELVLDWRRSQLSPSPAPWQAWVASHQDLGVEGLLQLAALVDEDRDMLLPAPADAAIEPAALWGTLEERFMRQLEEDGLASAEALQEICKGRGNGSPAGTLLGKTKLEELPALITTARSGLHSDPGSAIARRYRLLAQAYSTSQVRRVLNDADQAPTSGLHGSAERLCFEPIEALSAGLVHQLRQQASRQRQQRNELSFGDLLERVDPDRLSAEVIAGLRRWRQRELSCCLIDEFQDTDPIQWRLFAALFDGHAPLTLIGDPKQAIYRFRGGDIRTYRAATTGAARLRHSLDTNRRSDPALLEVLNGLFSAGEAFGTDAISYRNVQAPPGAEPSRLRQADGRPAPPVRLRWLGEEEGGTPLKLGALRQSMPMRVCDDLQRSLTAGLELQDGEHWRPLHPGDLAVLVRRNSDAVALQQELQRRGIPARIGRGGDLWQSPEAASLTLALESLEREGDRAAAAALAISSLGGWQARELQQWEPQQWGRWLQQLQNARQRWRQVGPLAALEGILAAGSAPERLLGRPGGEQRWSDLRQMGELLQQQWQEQGQAGPARLRHWLVQQQLSNNNGEESQQRIVASETMVTLTTLHSSKGLEFPLVWCPSLWDCGSARSLEGPFRAWDHQKQRRVLDISRRPGSSPRRDRLEEARLEEWQEQLRLGYVALTRAKHQLCIDWGRIKDSGASLPAWLLHPEQRQRGGQLPWEAISTLIKEAPDLLDRVRRRCQALGIQLETETAPSPATYTAPERELSRAADKQPLPQQRAASRWGRWSYSRLLEQRSNAMTSQREEEGFDPDRDSNSLDPGEQEDPSWSSLPGGASFGTLVHAILEQLDFQSDPFSGEVRTLVRDEVARSGLPSELNEALLPALQMLLSRPLGGPAGALRLNQVAKGDTLRELPFDLPLSGFASGPAVDVLAEALQQLALHPDAEVRRYANTRLQQRPPQLSSGFLNGVIDLIVRLPGEHDHWLVLDWKTNRLARPVHELMAAKDYWLQAQLYRQAVQRWLRLRMPASRCRRIDAVMLFTRSGEGAWLLQPGEEQT